MTTTASRPQPAQGEPGRRVNRAQTPRPDRIETISLVSSAGAVIVIICGWVLLPIYILGGISAQRSQHHLYAQLRSELAQETAPTGALDYNGHPIAQGAPVALLTIPSIGLEQVVVDGTTSSDLLAGPGHLRDTPLPGQAGVSVVFGRDSTYGAPFGRIDQLQKGQSITVLNAQGTVSYTVIDVRRAGDPVPAFVPGPSSGILTLVTAEGSGLLASLRPTSVIYVDATTSKALPTGPVAAQVAPSEQVMARDTSALPLLVLHLAAAVALVFGMSVARRHFRGALVWLIATPVAIALAWSTTDQVMRLLPNLM